MLPGTGSYAICIYLLYYIYVPAARYVSFCLCQLEAGLNLSHPDHWGEPDASKLSAAAATVVAAAVECLSDSWAQRFLRGPLRRYTTLLFSNECLGT